MQCYLTILKLIRANIPICNAEKRLADSKD